MKHEKEQEPKRYSFRSSQMICLISFWLILGIMIGSITNPIMSVFKVDSPSERRTQQPAIEAKIANKTGPTDLLAVSSVTGAAVQAKASKESFIFLAKLGTAKATSTPIIPEVMSTLATMATIASIPETMPTATAKPTAVATPTLTPTAKPTAVATPTSTPTATPKATSKSLTLSTYRSINMYTKPSKHSAKKLKIPEGATLTNVTEIGKGWLRVTHNGETGCVFYLFTSFLEEKKIFSPKDGMTYREPQRGVITADRVELRSLPGITSKSEVLAYLPKKTTVEVYALVEMVKDEYYGYAKVRVIETGQWGYIRARFLDVGVSISKNLISEDTDTGKTPSSNSSESKTGKKSSSSSSESKAGKKAAKDKDLDCGSGASTGKKATKNSKKSFKGVKLQFKAKYHITSNPLTRSGGEKWYKGHLESWYSEQKLPGGGLHIPGRHSNTADGTVRDKDGYICLASRTLPKGTTLMTSLGPGKVYDYCATSDVIDVYVNWDPPGKHHKQVKKQQKQLKKQRKQPKKQQKQVEKEGKQEVVMPQKIAA